MVVFVILPLIYTHLKKIYGNGNLMRIASENNKNYEKNFFETMKTFGCDLCNLYLEKIKDLKQILDLKTCFSSLCKVYFLLFILFLRLNVT